MNTLDPALYTRIQATIIDALDKADFDGCIMNDHLIDMVGGHYTCEAFFTSYLKGLVDGVQKK